MNFKRIILMKNWSPYRGDVFNREGISLEELKRKAKYEMMKRPIRCTISNPSKRKMSKHQESDGEIEEDGTGEHKEEEF